MEDAKLRRYRAFRGKVTKKKKAKRKATQTHKATYNIECTTLRVQDRTRGSEGKAPNTEKHERALGMQTPPALSPGHGE